MDQRSTTRMITLSVSENRSTKQSSFSNEQSNHQNKATMATLAFVEGFDLAKCERQYPEEWKKLSKAADIHGYGGLSRGGKDGIFNILRPSKKRDVGGDVKLYTVYERLRLARGKNLAEGGIPVKVVAHVPSGERLVGVYYPDSHTTFILGLGDYDGNILV